MRIYLSHPYGGKEENYEKAARIADWYRKTWKEEGKDWELINPLEYLKPLSDGIPEYTMIKLAINLMKSCDGVLFSPGWKRSRGCRFEHLAAHGMTMDEIPEEVGLCGTA